MRKTSESKTVNPNPDPTLGEALYLSILAIHGPEGLAQYWELPAEARAPWEAEAVRLIIRDTPEKDLIQGIDSVGFND
jgi:hypothetical protein